MEKLKYVFPVLLVLACPGVGTGGSDGSEEKVELPEPAFAELCGGEDNVDGQQCKRCPDYTPRGKAGADSDPFPPKVETLEVDGQPAFLASWGRGRCVPGAGGYSGIVLVMKDEETWSRVDHQMTISIDDCRKIEVSAPDPTLLCRTSVVRQGIAWTRLGTLTVNRDGLHIETLLQMTDNTAALCREGTDYIENQRIHDVTYDSEKETIEVEASAVRIALPDGHDTGLCADLYDEDSASDGRDYELSFPYEDGQFQAPDELVDRKNKLKNVPVRKP